MTPQTELTIARAAYEASVNHVGDNFPWTALGPTLHERWTLIAKAAVEAYLRERDAVLFPPEAATMPEAVCRAALAAKGAKHGDA